MSSKKSSTHAKSHVEDVVILEDSDLLRESDYAEEQYRAILRKIVSSLKSPLLRLLLAQTDFRIDIFFRSCGWPMVFSRQIRLGFQLKHYLGYVRTPTLLDNNSLGKHPCSRITLPK